MLLYSLGFGTAWLSGIGLFAAFHETAFLAVALIGFVGGAAMLFWRYQRFSRGSLVIMAAGLLLGCLLLWASVTYV